MEFPRKGQVVFLALLLALLVIAVLVVQKYRAATPPVATDTQVVEEPQVIREVRLYFGNDEGLFLAAETREIKNCLDDEDCLRETVQALLDGPAGGLVPVMPRNVAIRSVTEQSGVATVDFSREFLAGHPGGSVSELFTVYGLANTLADNFPYIRQVRVLVEGQSVQTLKGHVDLSRPVAADFRYVRRLDGGTGPEAGIEEITEAAAAADLQMARPGEAETVYPEGDSISPDRETPLPDLDAPLEEEILNNDWETPAEEAP